VGAGSAVLLTTGASNASLGAAALSKILTGSANVAIGATAGSNYAGAESNNIVIGNAGVAAESGVIRIGTAATQTKTFVAGVNGVTTGTPGSVVLVDPNGQLGTVVSSRRYKEDINPMGAASERLLKLRPVTFRYKKDQPSDERPIQYGLIAEEVAEVFPELVVYNKDGQPETVAYHLLAALLLNELQKSDAKLQLTQKLLTDQQSHILQQEQAIKAIQSQVRDLEVIKTWLRKTGGLSAPALTAEAH
jgi:hypothetical protein